MKILVVDDHALFREGIRLILLRLDPQAEVIEAGSAEAGLRSVAEPERVDLVLLDLNLPGLNGLDGLKDFRRRFPTSPVVLLSAEDTEAPIREGLAGGAQGFIHKSVSAETMLGALHGVLAGGTAFCPPPVFAPPRNDGGAADSSAPLQLTPRQIDVLRRLAEGRSNKEIGRDLAMSENTVRAHLSSIFRLLRAHSRTQAILAARRHGLL